MDGSQGVILAQTPPPVDLFAPKAVFARLSREVERARGAHPFGISELGYDELVTRFRLLGLRDASDVVTATRTGRGGLATGANRLDMPPRKYLTYVLEIVEIYAELGDLTRFGHFIRAWNSLTGPTTKQQAA